MRRAGAALALALLAAMPAPAQDAAPAPAPVQSPVLVLRQDALFEGSAYGRAARARFDAATAELLAENRQIEAGLEAEESALTDRRAVLSAAEFRPLAEAFDTKVEGIRTAQDAKSRAITREFETARQDFARYALPVLAEIMRERGATVILDEGTVVANLEAIDITAEAIARLDAAPAPASPPAPTPGPTPSPQPPDPSPPP